MRRRLVGDEPCRARPERRTVHAVIRLRLRRLLLGLAVVLVGLVGLARPASAHTERIGTDPAEDVVLAAAPTAITLTFGEGVETALGAIRVFDATGKPVVVGSPSHPGGDKARVQGSLPGLGVTDDTISAAASTSIPTAMPRSAITRSGRPRSGAK